MIPKWKRLLGWGTASATLIISSTLYARRGEDKDKLDNGLAITPRITAASVPTTVRGDQDELVKEAIRKSRVACQRFKEEKGIPGLAVGVSVNGKTVWQEGFGAANLEIGAEVKPESVMRIASISKSLTMAMLAKLMEAGKVDIDKPIQAYLPTFPQKVVDGKEVTITLRHVLGHLSGIRNYTKRDNAPPPGKSPLQADWEHSEFYLKDRFTSVQAALDLFQHDDLFHEPGTKFLYSTHGWTVVAAVIEKVTGATFPKHCRRMFDFWGLKNTRLDFHKPLVYNRVSYYHRNEEGQLGNAPYVDLSYKWAGGGFLSNVPDLLQFANILLYSAQTPEGSINTSSIPFLKQSTLRSVWRGNPVSADPDKPDLLYALGYEVGRPVQTCRFGKEKPLMTVLHTGGAMGSSSILMMTFPVPPHFGDATVNATTVEDRKEGDTPPVKGVVVAMLNNLTAASCRKTAEEIVDNFKGLI